MALVRAAWKKTTQKAGKDEMNQALVGQTSLCRSYYTGVLTALNADN